MATPHPLAQADLMALVRDPLGATNAVEKPMFGGVSFMVDGALAVSAGRDGSLLVRVIEDRYEDLIGRPGAHEAIMGSRSMSPGWLRVDAATCTDPDAVAFWVAQALDRVRMTP